MLRPAKAIALAPNMMAVSTCTSLIVFHTFMDDDAFGINGTWEFMPEPESTYPVHGEADVHYDPTRPFT